MDASAPVLSPRYGTWAFSPGDDQSWANVDFDDSGWQHVAGGQDWRIHSNYTKKKARGWYRQKVDANDLQVGSSALKLSMGIIAGADEVYVNGEKVGSTGSLDLPVCGDYIAWRQYALRPGLLRKKGNEVAVRVSSLGGAGTYGDNTYPGGLYDDPRLKDHDVRKGAFDAGASLSGRSYGYTVGGVGWYRKHFTWQPYAVGANDSIVRLQFDGVYMHSDMYLNGHWLGAHPYGYTSFEYVLPRAALAASNVLAVRVNNFGRNSRWYSGSGIYRHTYISAVPSLHFAQWGLYVSTPTVGEVKRAGVAVPTASTATVQAELTLVNAGAVAATAHVVIELFAGADAASSDHVIATATIDVTVHPNSSGTAAVNLTLNEPSLWEPGSPLLYTARARLPSATDSISANFGVRSIAVDARNGLVINGVETKLFGGCMHHDNGPLGAAAIDRAEERRVQLLKAHGYNAIRTSHNPVSPAFLDACDREGMLVMDEAFDCWEEGKNTDDYHIDFDDWWRRDIEAMVLRDRNHPSVVMWSIGNEIPMRETQKGFNLSAALSAYVRLLDAGSRGVHTGRGVTSAVPGVSDKDDPFFAPLEVAGYNYSPERYVSDHSRFPQRVIVGTESFPTASFEMWDLAWNNKHVIGDFIWTAFDYIGESDIGYESQSSDVDECAGAEPFPWHISFCGDLDNAGHTKPQALYRRVLWGVDVLAVSVHVPGQTSSEHVGPWGWPEERPSWTWPGFEGHNVSVKVYAKGGGLHMQAAACTSVSLLVNGQQVAASDVGHATQYTASFAVPYTCGTLTARCHAAGEVLESVSIATAGAPAALKLTPDRATIANSRDDLSFVTVEVVDADGVLVPDAALPLSFSLDGGGLELAALGNGDPQDIDSTQSTRRRTWRGKAVAIVRPTVAAVAAMENASAFLKVESPGVLSASIKLSAQAL